MRRLATFVIAFATWCLLTWPYDAEAGRWDVQSLLTGLAAAVLVALVVGGVLTRQPGALLNPLRWFWLLAFLPVFAYYCMKANLQVAYLVLHPKMPIHPGIVKLRTRLRTEAGICALANAITLTPGTLTVDAEPDGTLYVHWIDVKTTDAAEAAAEIAGRFEPFLARVFE
jgi:multicomponent Na+:H+ antiporter subunit E